MKKVQSVFSVKLCERLMPNDFYDNIFVAGNSIFYIYSALPYKSQRVLLDRIAGFAKGISKLYRIQKSFVCRRFTSRKETL